MEFGKFRVTGSQPIKFFSGSVVRLTSEQYRRRYMQTAKHDETAAGYICWINTEMTFKAGEIFELAGTMPKAYAGMVEQIGGKKATAPEKKPRRRRVKKAAKAPPATPSEPSANLPKVAEDEAKMGGDAEPPGLI